MSGTPPRFATDLNQRERRRHATALRDLSAVAAKAAEALLAEDDAEAMVHVLFITLGSQATMTELIAIFQAAALSARFSGSLDEPLP